ncbi:MltA-interacting MipA family protein [Vibrio sp. 10N.286.49.B3]|uniref:MipA/OmpV family protein n=1 Tax=Vibrio sp. 10N.286.49.B3 TaxID=1880855 RepID=UPI000C840BB8|nr:MipA/OmpV family protein [Vibrio sp. 10N.286.49.B3]PMH46553.1 MltA-interacting MipA family protein [Vibrio sp. 10N.286.49.B3]
MLVSHHYKTWLAACLSSLFATDAYAQNAEQEWGIAAMYRLASIPYETGESDQSVSTFVPMMFFENEYVYVDGLEGGVFLYNDAQSPWQASMLTRLRFIDIPQKHQNAIEGDTADYGFQVQYQLNNDWKTQVELMTDSDYNLHVNWRLAGEYHYGDWQLKPHLNLRYKDSDFNSAYYALSAATNEDIGAGVDVSVGINAKYHVMSNLYLLGSTSFTRLDDNAYQSFAVDKRYEGEVFFGFGFFNNKDKAPKSQLSNKPYLRVAHGWATPSNMGDILKFNRVKDQYNNQMSSVFYGHPLTDELFGLPLDIYLTPGIAHHWSSKVQRSSTEFIVAIKAYYTLNWPTTWRIGVAEGMSYIDNVTYIEQTEMDEKGYVASHLLNYMDISFDVNIGDLMNKKELSNMWLGYSMHHRSAIFEQSSQYGRIKGGSNYNTIYLQYEF